MEINWPYSYMCCNSICLYSTVLFEQRIANIITYKTFYVWFQNVGFCSHFLISTIKTQESTYYFKSLHTAYRPLGILPSKSTRTVKLVSNILVNLTVSTWIICYWILNPKLFCSDIAIKDLRCVESLSKVSNFTQWFYAP